MDMFRQAVVVAGSTYFGWLVIAGCFAAVSGVGFRLSRVGPGFNNAEHGLRIIGIGALKCTLLACAIGLLGYFLRGIPFTGSHLADALALEFTLLGGCIARLIVHLQRCDVQRDGL